ncbi:MAG TPA: type VI secretion system tube protein Hcp [Acetobacteraceae bacterium]
MSIYMKFGDIKGSVTTDGFKDWINLDSFQWGVGRSVNSTAGGSDTREGSEPSVSEIVVTKRLDKASPSLWQDAVGGDFSKDITITMTTTTKDKVESYLEYELKEVGLSGYSAAGGADGAPSESLSLNFASVIWKYTGRDSKIAGKPDIVGWSLTQQKKI